MATYVFSKQGFELRSNGIRVIGTIIGSGLENSILSDNSKARGSFSMIEYKDASGRLHKIRRSLAGPFSRLKKGDMVEVLYPARHPEAGILNTWDELFLTPFIFGIMMLAFLVLFHLILNGTIRS